jgi:hypothetical protein
MYLFIKDNEWIVNGFKKPLLRRERYWGKSSDDGLTGRYSKEMIRMFIFFN